MEAFDGRLLDRAVHPLDLTVGPGMVRLGEPVLDVVRFADHVEAHLTRPGGVTVARLLGKLDAVVGPDRVNPVRHRFQQVFKELPRRSPVSLVDKLGDREFTRAADADEQVELAFGSLHLGDIHAKEPDRVALEALSLWPFDFAQESLVPSMSGRRDMPYRCRQRCSAVRVRCGIDGCNA
jgi:hypothetical protein